MERKNILRLSQINEKVNGDDPIRRKLYSETDETTDLSSIARSLSMSSFLRFLASLHTLSAFSLSILG